MIGPTLRYAVRSVGRNVRRTALAVVGIAIGCALALVMQSINKGRDELFARAGAASGAGHVRIAPAGWMARRDARLRLVNGDTDLAIARALPEAAAVTARARADVLLAMGTHVVATQLVGVDPDHEPDVYRAIRQPTEGRYLRRGDRGAVVVGRAIALRLSAELDDEILVSAVGRGGDIQSQMLRIVGIIRMGSDDLDATICQASLDDVAALSGLPGLGEIVINLRDWRQTDRVRDRLAAAIPPGDAVTTWGDINPEFKGHMQQDQAMSRVISGLILLIVLIGVASAQLAAVLERRREFAVLAALGMRGGQMATALVLEAVTIGVLGALAGLALGGPLVWRLATRGWDLSGYIGTNFSAFGVVIEPIIYGDLGLWIVSYVATVALISTIAASIYPAWFAVRTDPAAALRVAQ